MTGEAGARAYPKLAGGAPDFPALELEVLDSWTRDDTFRASISQRDGAEEYVFYDGPPFANGLPHYGHLLTGYVKDIVPRYRTMRGYKVDRRFGWDTHGLPAELEVERQLGITDKSQIDDMGIAAFNEACRESVLRYTAEWQAYVTRQARWVDFDNDYKTLDLPYMESVIWAFKQLWDKRLAYEGYRVLPYCWRDETPLSNHELRMDDDVYQSRQDPAVTVGFRVAAGGAPKGLAGAYLLVWTTTPWTLPSNLAVAVNPEVTYVQVKVGDRRFVLAEARLAAYAKELGEEPEILGTYSGADLLGTRYLPPFPYFMESAKAFQVLPGDFVTTDDGTGIVHMAPAYGEDDMATTDKVGIVPVTPVDSKGRFDVTVPDYRGQHVFDANPHIIRDLKNQSGPAAVNQPVLIRHETYEHPYPHCWRCRNPLIYRAVSSWFVAVTEFRDRMVELNQQITWYPDHVKDGQFGKWLQGARDWSISRNRYWGSPIPVWKSDDPAYPRIDVYGSLDELERDFGVRPTNLHRPYIDELTRPNPDDPTGNSTMRRIPDVLDVWFDSGSMPYAQVHFPFENADWFAGGAAGEGGHYPGDFIVEYIGQTRGWFYTLHVLATALFDRPAFKTCVAHGIVLGSDGQKMSKSLRNYPDVSEVFDRDGSDAMRWFLMASPILRGGNLIVTEQGIREGVRQVLLPLWNAYSFLALYAPKVGAWRTDSAHVLDRYILAKLAVLRDDLTDSLEVCDISGACEQLRQFTEALTNWYVRRSRSRFWEEDADAIDTLHTVLEVTSRLAAPLLPLITEIIWRGLTGERSVHLTDWPRADALPADAELVAAMDQVREVCSAASSLRKAKKLRVRLPLPKLTVAVEDPQQLVPFTDLIADELNVKQVELTDAIDTYGRFELTVNARVAGPRLGKDVQAAIKAVKAGEGVVNPDGTLTAGPAVLQPEEYSSRLVAADPEFTAALPGGAGLVVLDGTVTPELEAEGWAKDRIRELQELRKSTGLDVSDRIRVVMSVPAERADWARAHRDLIAGEILATSFEFGDPVAGTEIGDGVRVEIAKS
ncbi:isoleucine--tRNA ligase [Mycobacterium sp. 050128]|uniref:isoleucine--tRNA ligase n=1 Tax=Mycobacterium sp. 050128 TaxID=3096112 RepID=UPI002ED8CFE9